MNTPNYPYFLYLVLFLLICHTYSHAQKAVPKDGFIHLKGGKYPLGDENIPITLTPFAISPTEVTYGQMSLFTLHYGRDPKQYHYDGFGDPDAERVAVGVDWFDAIRYANWLSVQKGLGAVYTVYGGEGVLNPEDESYWDDESWARVDFDIEKKGYRLPTEAEWEYAASGYEALGKKQVYPGTDEADSLKEYAWNDDNSENRAHKTATLQPNAEGVYDMGGNVWEWCFDGYKKYVFETFENQENPFFQSGKRPYDAYHSIRGGGWDYSHLDCRVSTRNFVNANDASHDNGFRLVRTL